MASCTQREKKNRPVQFLLCVPRGGFTLDSNIFFMYGDAGVRSELAVAA